MSNILKRPGGARKRSASSLERDCEVSLSAAAADAEAAKAEGEAVPEQARSAAKAEGKAAPKKKKARSAATLHTADEGSPAGPDDVVGLFAWASQFWPALRERGEVLFGVDLAAKLLENLLSGVCFATEYSGIGCPEHALAQILEAACELYPEHADALREAIKAIRAGDMNKHCRSVLLGVEGDCRPECVYGDLTERCPPELYARGVALAEKFRKQARAACGVNTTRNKRKTVMREFGEQFLQDGARLFLGDQQEAGLRDAHCYRHGKRCRVRGRPMF